MINKKIKSEYDFIVIGAGHAGVEAASILDKLNSKVALITFSENDIASLPCNVSIGGSAKGIVVRELFSLGGLMPIAADETQLQTKILNLSKGPAVHALRAQVDKIEYPNWIKNNLKERKNLHIIEAAVDSLFIEENKTKGVYLSDGSLIKSKAVILCTGTFLNSKTMKGKEIKIEGPDGKKTTKTISEQLEKYEIDLIRLKTGTPPRVKKDSIDFTKFEIEPGSRNPIYFSENNKISKEFENIPAWLVYTNNDTHRIIERNMDKSYLYSEDIVGSGPRYCPSIEDKVKRFNDKDRHQIFLELESKNMDTIYLAGLSSSLPKEIQEEYLRTIPGFEDVVIDKYAYAIEYDSIIPTQLKQTLEFKKIENLYSAGQINGTSGYEEAAAQGLYAAVNAYNKVNQKEEFILDRNESYIGVMIDDITTKKLYEPYRLLTSRAEYRLLLRDDNSTKRLYKKAYKNNLISKEYYGILESKFKLFKEIREYFDTSRLKKENKNFVKLLEEKNININVNSIPTIDILKRPEFKLKEIIEILKKDTNIFDTLTENDIKTIEIETKFEGYIKKQEIEVKNYLKNQYFKIPDNFDYNSVMNLALEAREKLDEFRPRSIHQASKIQGINPSDIMILINYFKRTENNKELEK